MSGHDLAEGRHHPLAARCQRLSTGDDELLRSRYPLLQLCGPARLHFLNRQRLPFAEVHVVQASIGLCFQFKGASNGFRRLQGAAERAAINGLHRPGSCDAPPGSLRLLQPFFIQRDRGASPEARLAVQERLSMSYQNYVCHLVASVPTSGAPQFTQSCARGSLR